MYHGMGTPSVRLALAPATRCLNVGYVLGPQNRAHCPRKGDKSGHAQRPTHRDSGSASGGPCERRSRPTRHPRRRLWSARHWLAKEWATAADPPAAARGPQKRPSEGPQPRSLPGWPSGVCRQVPLWVHLPSTPHTLPRESQCTQARM